VGIRKIKEYVSDHRVEIAAVGLAVIPGVIAYAKFRNYDLLVLRVDKGVRQSMRDGRLVRYMTTTANKGYEVTIQSLTKESVWTD